MNRTQLIEAINTKQSYLCTGLDTEIQKLPVALSRDGSGLVEFNRNIIEATLPHSVAYKINTAFYEQYGSDGWIWMEQTLGYLPKDVLRIADAKRGDIGNTSSMYAKAFFETLDFDAITVSPYMGEDSIRPFLEFNDKWVICLALTSNPGHSDFQKYGADGKALFERVIESVSKWGNPNNLMFVVGATRADELSNIRKIIPDHFLLVPGVGSQGGDLKEVSRAGLNTDCGLLINASRSIIYASSGADYAQKASESAKNLHQEMRGYLELMSG